MRRWLDELDAGPTIRALPTHKAELERQHRAIDAFQAVVTRHFNRLDRVAHGKAQNERRMNNRDWQRFDKEFYSDKIGR